MQKVDSDPEAKVRSASTPRFLGQRLLVESVGPLVCLLRPQLLLTSVPPPSLFSLPEIHRPRWFQNPTLFSVSRNHLAYSLVLHTGSRSPERAG